MKLLIAVAVLTACLGSLVMGYKYAQLQRVVQDQQIYMDAGCKGWYQGAE